MPEPLVRVSHLAKEYPLRQDGGMRFRFRRKVLRAVDGLSFEIRPGEVLGLVGESGSGKTTTGKILCRLEEPTAGRVDLDGADIFRLRRADLLRFRRRVQMIFQDPYESLDPRLTVGQAIREGLDIHGISTGGTARDDLVRMSLEEVGLTPVRAFVDKYPHLLSGGQRQRVAIARAAVLEPKFIVADEPVSMLDVSVRAGILNLMLDMRQRHGASIVFITHDLASARYMCDRIAVMYLGKIVEIAPTDEVIERPQHPYTRILLSSVLEADPDLHTERIAPQGDPPRQGVIPSGCRFHPRCPIAEDRCIGDEPGLLENAPGHSSACFFPGTL